MINHVGDTGFSEADDSTIWQFARDRNWILMTKDGDFADMALLYGAPPKVIRVRIGNSPWQSASDIVIEHRDAVEAFLADPASSLLILGPHSSI